jgi:hypothetical protein
MPKVAMMAFCCLTSEHDLADGTMLSRVACGREGRVRRRSPVTVSEAQR